MGLYISYFKFLIRILEKFLWGGGISLIDMVCLVAKTGKTRHPVDRGSIPESNPTNFVYLLWPLPNFGRHGD